jgi:hypothetical protein
MRIRRRRSECKREGGSNHFHDNDSDACAAEARQPHLSFELRTRSSDAVPAFSDHMPSTPGLKSATRHPLGMVHTIAQWSTHTPATPHTHTYQSCTGGRTTAWADPQRECHRRDTPHGTLVRKCRSTQPRPFDRTRGSGSRSCPPCLAEPHGKATDVMQTRQRAHHVTARHSPSQSRAEERRAEQSRASCHEVVQCCRHSPPYMACLQYGSRGVGNGPSAAAASTPLMLLTTALRWL